MSNKIRLYERHNSYHDEEYNPRSDLYIIIYPDSTICEFADETDEPFDLWYGKKTRWDDIRLRNFENFTDKPKAFLFDIDIYFKKIISGIFTFE
jgi:hypothetical protein